MQKGIPSRRAFAKHSKLWSNFEQPWEGKKSHRLCHSNEILPFSMALLFLFISFLFAGAFSLSNDSERRGPLLFFFIMVVFFSLLADNIITKIKLLCIKFLLQTNKPEIVFPSKKWIKKEYRFWSANLSISDELNYYEHFSRSWIAEGK